MAKTEVPAQQQELERIEEKALEHISKAGIPPIEEVAREPLLEEAAPPIPIVRISLVAAFPVLAAAAMAGGVFLGFSPRIWAAISGVLGVLIAFWARKVRRPGFMYALIVLGIIGVGFLLVIPSGFGNLFDLGGHVRQAIAAGETQRPPVLFEPGWRAIMGWLMAAIGFAAGWVALEFRRPALAMLLPLPVVAFTAISVPEEEQMITGVLCLVLFAIGLGLLSGTEMGDQEQKPSLAFEIRRAVRGVPMIGGIVGIMFLLSQADFLFPRPIIDPTQEAKLPKTVPLSEVEDRVLFRVKSSITGPWRIGHLDVYDGESWRLPPFAASRLEEVPRSGVVDSELVPGVKAEFEIADLGGAVLPGLPNNVGIVAVGPKLAYDDRLGNIRLAQGTIQAGLEYTVVAAPVPTIEALGEITADAPPEIEQFLEIPPPPPGVQRLLAQAPTTSKWDRMNFVREHLLKTVVASGAGTPIPVPPSKVDDMLEGSKEGTPFEIVAGQAMLARWAGVPSRIAYGYDGGQKVDEFLEVRPRHGASFLEVYFPTFKWVPVIGTPLQAKSSLSSDPQQFNPQVLASDDLAVRVHIPIALERGALLFAQVRRILLVLVPAIALILAAYYTWPAVWKAVLRNRRRNWADSAGPAARISVAYAEWRDTATDFGYRFDSDTPLMFLDRIVEDEEHTEFAWLVTRTLWGDLRGNIDVEDAVAAEELSKSLRRRLGQAHPYTLRSIAAVSRLSLRHQFAALRPAPTKTETKEDALVPA